MAISCVCVCVSVCVCVCVCVCVLLISIKVWEPLGPGHVLDTLKCEPLNKAQVVYCYYEITIHITVKCQ